MSLPQKTKGRKQKNQQISETQPVAYCRNCGAELLLPPWETQECHACGRIRVRNLFHPQAPLADRVQAELLLLGALGLLKEGL